MSAHSVLGWFFFEPRWFNRAERLRIFSTARGAGLEPKNRWLAFCWLWDSARSLAGLPLSVRRSGFSRNLLILVLILLKNNRKQEILGRPRRRMPRAGTTTSAHDLWPPLEFRTLGSKVFMLDWKISSSLSLSLFQKGVKYHVASPFGTSNCSLGNQSRSHATSHHFNGKPTWITDHYRRAEPGCHCL